MKKILISAFVLCIGGLLITYAFHLNPVKDDVTESIFLTSQQTEREALQQTYQIQNDAQNTYYQAQTEWSKKGYIRPNDVLNMFAYDFVEDLHIDTNYLGYDGDAAWLNQGDQLSMSLDVTTSGIYALYFDYYVEASLRYNPSMRFLVDGVLQYTELSYLSLPVDWLYEDTKSYDRYGDQIASRSYIKSSWYLDQGIQDGQAFYQTPLEIYLSAGTHDIQLEVIEGTFHLGTITLKNVYESTQTYEDYIAPYETYLKYDGLLTLQAEDVLYRNRQSIRNKYMREPKVAPYSYKNRVLNVLDGNLFGEANDEITYEVDIETAGLYNLAFKYSTGINGKLPSIRRIEIDGVTPFKALEHYIFKNATSFRNETLNQDGKPYWFYLSEGKHTITLKVTNETVKDIYHDLLAILSDIQAVSLDIHQITGGLSDANRDWRLEVYLPDLDEELLVIKEKITQAIRDIETNKAYARSMVLTELNIALKQINRFVKNPNVLPKYMDEFSNTEGSIYGRINRVMPMLTFHPLHLDQFYLYGDHKLPKANASLFLKVVEEFKAFFYSFFDDKYQQTSSNDENTIDIWVSKSRPYMEIMQRMIDETYTPETGINVNLSLMPDENKIILSNAAGTTPDGVVGLSFSKPFEFALRNMIVDLRDQPGFYDLASEFNYNSFVPYIYQEGVYAIPETQDVKLLFYRKDILNRLNILPPDTWAEVISAIPVLQKYDMNIFVPLGDANAYKGSDKTVPFIYQMGGDLYDLDTLESGLHQENAYQGFELMTELFTIYNLPTMTENFFQKFRNGDVPMGIGDANMYIQLKYAAPELSGQWGVLPIPGVQNALDEVERWHPTYGGSSVIFSSSNKQAKTWDFIKWWSKKEIQADYSYQIQSALGNKFLYMTANIEGFRESAWPIDTKYIILDQWQWIRSTGRVPGDYMLERELSNAWNHVVFDGANPRIAINEATLIINLELRRKLVEFDYFDLDGNLLKPYYIPTYDTIDWWFTDNDN